MKANGRDGSRKVTCLRSKQPRQPALRRLCPSIRALVLLVGVLVLVWYPLHVVASRWASDSICPVVLGCININIDYISGLVEFAPMFIVSYLFTRRAYNRLDPFAIQDEWDKYEGTPASRDSLRRPR